MHHSAIVLTILCFTGLGNAQGSSGGLSTDTAVGVFARDGGLVDLQFVRSNLPLPGGLMLEARAGGAAAQTAAATNSPGSLRGATISERGDLRSVAASANASAGTTTSTAPGSLAIGPHSFLLATGGPFAGVVIVTFDGDAANGAAAWGSVDVGADGSVEFRQAADGDPHQRQFAVVTSSELRIRLTTSGLARLPAGSNQSSYRANMTVELRAVPELPCAITPYGQGCGPQLTGQDVVIGNVHNFGYQVTGAFPGAPVAFVFGDRRINVRIPGTMCPLLANPLVLITVRADQNGDVREGVQVPGGLAGVATVQVLPWRLRPGGIEIRSSNALAVDCGP